MQADLFNLSMANSFERQAFQKSFFEKRFTLRMDQLVGLSLVTIVFFVLVFSWGVERGKADSRRDYMLHQGQSSRMPQQIEKLPGVDPSVKSVGEVSVSQQPLVAQVELATDAHMESPVQPQAVAKVASSAAIPAGAKYTIAHITYVKKDQALNEVGRIKSKGYSSFLVSSGRFFQICVSGFESRKTANDAIKTLKLKGIVSPDSYIRNMPAGH